MSDQDGNEPLQELPPGMARRYAEYKPASAAEPSPPPTTVGGYDELRNFLRAKGLSLPRSRKGLQLIDSLIDDPGAKASLEGLTRAIGMFYGDVLTHTIPGAHWEVIEEDLPNVRISRKTSVAVIHVAERRLTLGIPTLVMNYDHVLDLLDQEPFQGLPGN